MSNTEYDTLIDCIGKTLERPIPHNLYSQIAGMIHHFAVAFHLRENIDDQKRHTTELDSLKMGLRAHAKELRRSCYVDPVSIEQNEYNNLIEQLLGDK